MATKIKEAINYIVWKILPSCKDVASLMSKSLDGTITFREWLTMKVHLWTCYACQRYLSQIQFLGDAVKKHASETELSKSAPKLTPDAIDRLKKAVRSSKTD